MGQKRGHKRFWCKSQKGSDHLEDLAVDRMVILKSVLRKLDGASPGLKWLMTGTSGRACTATVMNILVPYNWGGGILA